MCVLAMSFSVVYSSLLLFVVVCLYFVPGRGCFIAANLGLSLIATMATSTALRTIVEGMSSIVLAALRQGTAMCYNVSTALRTIVETMMFVSGCVVFILRKLTAMCYGTAALCALIIKWVLSALCARMYLYPLCVAWLYHGYHLPSAQLSLQHYKPGGLSSA